MATRAIVTSQPEVACDICARRLLRGEQPETFVTDGQRCLVCELCTPRARSAGWVPVSEAVPQAGPAEEAPGPSGALRGLVRRWRGSGREAPPKEAWSPPEALDSATMDAAGAEQEALASEEEMWAFEDAARGSAAVGLEASATPVRAPGANSSELEPAGTETAGPLPASEPIDGARAGAAPAGPLAEVPTGAEAVLAEGVALFNATDVPQRIAGIARSLGAPTVTVRRAEPGEVGQRGGAEGGTQVASGGASCVLIVAAWELCWYRWEVDLARAALEAPLAAQGSELEELAPADLAGNAAVDQRGSVHLY